MRFSFSTPKVIDRVLKCIWESKMGTPSSARIIQDVDLVLKLLEIFYHENGDIVEALDDSNGHIWKVVGEGKKISWELHGPKLRGASANSPKICSCTVIC